MNDDLWDVRPYRGVGPLDFGMTRDQVKALLGVSQPFVKNQFSTSVSEELVDGLVHCYFDSKDRLEFVEMFPGLRLSYADVPNLFSLDPDDLIERLSLDQIDEPIIEFGNYEFHGLGLAFYAPSQQVESFAIFVRGYYD